MSNYYLELDEKRVAATPTDQVWAVTPANIKVWGNPFGLMKWGETPRARGWRSRRLHPTP